MPNIHTHLHLGILLSEKIEIKNFESFLLGNAYPDCWEYSNSKALDLHYKKDVEDDCHFISFEPQNDFYLGYYFHLWVDNYIKNINTGDITKQDCLICDSEIIHPYVMKLKQLEVIGKEKEAMENIEALEKIPMLLYIVPEEKKLKYKKILDQIVDQFIKKWS